MSRAVETRGYVGAATFGLHTGRVSPGAALLALVSGCVVGDPVADEPPPPIAVARVADFVTTTCSTGVVRGLSIQIAEEIGCMMPGALVELAPDDGIELAGAHVLPFLSEEAIAALSAAAATSSVPLVVNSAFRSVAQQFLIRSWYDGDRCGIAAAAQPGASNHESGRALDVDNWSSWVSGLDDHGWDQTVPGDEVHFDHVASPDIRGADVLAFQRLWNRNHPGDPIDEDGDWGPQTRARMQLSPAQGFAKGSCLDAMSDPAPGGPSAELIGLEAVHAEAAGGKVAVVVELANTGGTVWQPGDTFLASLDDRGAPATRLATVEVTTAPGEVGRFRVDVAVAPDLAATFALDHGDGTPTPPIAGLRLTLDPTSAAPHPSPTHRGCTG